MLRQFLLISILFFFWSCQPKYIDETVISKLEVLENERHFKEVLNETNKLLDEYPKDPVLYFHRAKALFQLKRNKDAFFSINKAIELDENYKGAYNFRAVLMLYYDLGSKDLIIHDYRKAIILTQDKGSKIRLLKSKANACILLEDVKEGHSTIMEIKELVPNDVDADILLGRLLKVEHRFSESLQIFDSLIAIYPSNDLLYDTRAFTFIEAKEYDKALKDFEKVLDLMSAQKQNHIFESFAHNNIGYCYYLKKDYKKALEKIQYSISMNATNAYAFKNRALVYIALGKEEEACQDLTKANNIEYIKEVKTLMQTNCREEVY